VGRTRGAVIRPKTYRRLSDKRRGRRSDIFKNDWEEMAQCPEEYQDQAALELFVEFQACYPGRYSLRQLHTLQNRVGGRQAVQLLISKDLQPNAECRFRCPISWSREATRMNDERRSW
jgi:hypothetical protein